jgi:LysR family glycine cleavage system transcriptional activator
MSHRLPPLNTLRLFEAAGRKLSFKLAAEELEVTPSAVSHAVQALEDWLGSPLFHRSRRGISLTLAGESYLPAVSEALKLLASAGDRIANGPEVSTLHISVTPTFGSRVLLPRLYRFRELYPRINVSIDTTHVVVEFPRDGADLGIRLGHGIWPDVVAELLLTEILIPVCSPALLQRLGPSPLLCDAPLIHITTGCVSQDWAAWAVAAGRGSIDCQRGLKVDNTQMAIEAAVQGLGIAIGRRPMVDAELEQGTLVRFDAHEVASEASYWIVAPAECFARPEVQAFREWLLEELRPFRKEGERNGAQNAEVFGLSRA